MPIWGAGPRQEIRLTNIDRKNLFVLRSACCGRSSTTAAARGNYRQIPSFTMSISDTHTFRVAKLVMVAGRMPDFTMEWRLGMVEPDGIEPTTSSLQS